MDAQFQTSFIPKKSTAAGISTRRPPLATLFFVISVIIFVITLVATIGVFSYKKIIIDRITNMSTELSSAKNAFEPRLIDTLTKFSNRVEVAKQVIGAHSVVSPIFDLLENETLASITFDNFKYDFNESGVSSLSMTGQAKSFNSVALQSDIFGQEKLLKGPVFSDLNLDQSGNVIFKFSVSVDRSLTSYKNLISKAVLGSI